MTTITDLSPRYGLESDIKSSNNPKHDTIKDYEIRLPHKELGVERLSDGKESTVDLTLCYVVWDNPMYIKFLYLSIISQILYTDVLNLEKIVLYTDRRLRGLVKEVFSEFLESDFNFEIRSMNPNEIIFSSVVNNFKSLKEINKYLVSLDEGLRETDLLLISDCESFIYGKKDNIYEKIYETYKSTEGDFPILGCRQNVNRSVFLDRRRDLAGAMYNDNEYINWVVRRLDVDKQEFINKIVNWNKWYLTCWFLFDNNKYHHENEEWEKYVKWCRNLNIHCDESVYLTYGRTKKDYVVEDLNFVDGLEFVESRNCERFFEMETHKSTGVIHPLHGTYSRDFWVHRYWDHIRESFIEKLTS